MSILSKFDILINGNTLFSGKTMLLSRQRDTSSIIDLPKLKSFSRAYSSLETPVSLKAPK